MAIPTFVNSTSDDSSPAIPNLPASVQNGDVLILAVISDSDPSDPDSNEWIPISGTSVDNMTHLLRVYYTIYDSASPPDRTVTNWDGQDHLATLSAWRGCSVTPAHKQKQSTQASPTTSVSATGVTTDDDDCLIVVIHAGSDNVTTGFWTNSNLASPSITEAFDYTSTAGSDRHIACAYGGLATAGASGTTTATIQAAEIHCNAAIALTPTEDTSHPKIVGYEFGAIDKATLTLNALVDVEDDDIWLLHIECKEIETLAPPTGGAWTLIGSQAVGSVHRSAVYYHRYSTSAPNLVIPDPGTYVIATLIGVRGCVTSGSPINASQSTIDNTAGTTWSASGVTPTEDNCLVVCFTAQQNDRRDTFNGNNTLLGILQESAFTRSDGAQHLLASKQDTAAATGAFTGSLNAAEMTLHWVIALEPEPTGETVSLVAAITGTGLVSSLLTKTVPLTGAVISTGLVNSLLTFTADLNSVIAGSGVLTADLSRTKTLSGSIDSTALVTSTLNAKCNAAGDITATAFVTSDLELVKNLNGAISGSGLVVAGFNLTKNLNADIAGSATVTSNLKVGGVQDLAGDVTGTATALSSLSVTASLVSDIDGSGLLAATISKTVPFDATISGSGLLSSSLSKNVGILADIAATGLLVSDVNKKASLLASISNSVTVTAGLNFNASLAADVVGTGLLTADVSIGGSVQLAGDITGSGDLTSTVILTVGLFSDVVSSGQAVSSTNVIRGISASIDSSALVTANLSVGAVVSLSANVTATANISSNLNRTRNVSGDINGTSLIDSTVTATKGLLSSVNGSGLTASNLNCTFSLNADITCTGFVTSILSGLFTIDVQPELDILSQDNVIEFSEGSIKTEFSESSIKAEFLID